MPKRDDPGRFDAQNSATIRRFERKFDKVRELDEAAQRGMKAFISDALGEFEDKTKTRRNIAREFMNTRDNSQRDGTSDQFRRDNVSGYIKKNEELDQGLVDTEFGRLPTGKEKYPWQRSGDE